VTQLVALLCFTTVAFSSTAFSAEVFYETFRPGDPVVDQKVGSPGSHSYLVGTVGDEGVRDDEFGRAVALPALKAGASLFLSFGQCFSGGLIDELAPLGGNQFIITSARHSETASYGIPAPAGVDIDFTDAFILAMGDGHNAAESVAERTAAIDPFGPNPNAPRKSEPMGHEHTQYFAAGKGATLRPADFTKRGMAVLWAGMPAERDRVQMHLMIDRLVQMGYDRDRVWLLYADGKADISHPVVRDFIAGRDNPIHLLAATRRQLVGLFAQMFSESYGDRPDFVFLYVGDHGGLNRLAVAKHFFDQPDMLIMPNLSIRLPQLRRLYGEGHRF